MFIKLNYIILYVYDFLLSLSYMKVNRMTIAYISLFLLPIFKLRCVTTDLLFLLHFLCDFLCFSQLDRVYPHSLYREEQLLFISFVFPSWKTVTMAWNEDNNHRISFRVKPNTKIFLPSSYLVSKSKQPPISDRFRTFTALNSIWMWLAKLNNTSTHIPGIQLTFGNQ